MSFPRRKNSLSAMLDHNTENPIIKSALSGKRRFLPTENQPVYKIVVPKPGPQEYFQPQPQLRKRLMKSEPPLVHDRYKDSLPDTKIKRNYSCSKCAFFTQNPRTNLYHHRDVHGDKGNIFECTSCLYASKHAQKLQRHIRMCHEPQPHDENQDQNENESQNHSEENTEVKSQTVSEDDQNEGQGSDEDEGETNESQQEIKEETDGSRLRSGESSQPPPAPLFKCKSCEYETGDKIRYKKHVKGHSSSMIKCSICDFKTPYKWNLDRHLKNHNNGGSLKCPICNFSAEIKQSIGVHIQNHHHSLSDAKIEELLKTINTKPEPEVEPEPEAKFSDSLPILVDERGQPDESRLNFINPEDILEKNGKIYFKKLKCPKANCDFRAVWETELNRHLSRAHSVSTQRRSMPTLHPIVPITETQTPSMKVETPSTPKPKPISSSINYPKKRSLFLDNLSQRLQKAAKAQVRTKTALQSLEMSRSARRQSSNEKEGINGKIWDDYSGIETEQGVGVIRAIHHRNVDVTEFEPTTRRVFKCPHNNCTFWTTTAPRFHVHIIDHSGKRPFECSLCHYKSNWSWDITKHIRMKGAKDAGHLRARVLATNTESGEKHHKDYDKYLIPMQILMDSGETKSKSKSPPEKAKATTSKNVTAPKPKPMPKVESAVATAVTGTRDVKPNVPQAQAVLPKMPTLTRAPSHIFAQAIARSSIQEKSSPSPPILKQSSDCRTFVDKNMLSGGQMLQQPEHEQKSSSGTPRLKISPSGSPRMQKSPHGYQNGDFESNGSPPLKRPKLSAEEEKLKRWKCKMCPFRDEDKAAVVVHIRQFHKKDKESFLKMNEPNIANIWGSESPSPPRPVIKPTATPIIRETHQYTFENDMFNCKFCPFKAKVLRLMEAHSENHFSKLNHHYVCEHCSFSVKTERELNEHIVLHLGNGNGPNSPSLVILPEETPPKPPGAGSSYKKYHCIECPYVTDSRGQFQYHRQFHQARIDSPYKCNHCSYSVSHKHLLHQHTRVHFAKTSETNGNGSVNGDNDSILINGNGNGHQNTPPPKKSESEVSEDHPTVLMWRDGIAYKVYRCRSCPQIFEGLTDLLQHESSHSTENENEGETEVEPTLELQQQEVPTRNQELRLALCKFCPARFFNAKDLVIHASFHRIRSTHRCQACSYSVKSRTHLESHMKVHGLEYQKKTQEYFLKLNKIRCPRCPARLPNEPSFQHHYGFHGKDTEFNCGHCDFGADNAKNLMLHEFIHALVAEKASRMRSIVGMVPKTIASGETVITEFGMDTEDSPKQRIRRSYRNDDEACQGNPEFSYPTYLKNGKEKEKRYKCKLCPSAFEKRDQYNVHMGLHGSNQRYRCTICDYSVTYYANFAQHLKKHQSQPEIPKELLMALATPISKMMGNGGSPTPTMNLRCTNCPFFAETQKELVEHEMQHGRNSPGRHPCQFCDFAAIDNKSLVRHTKYHFQNVAADSYMFAPQGIDLIDPRNGQKIYSEKENHTAVSHASSKSKDSSRMTYVDMVKALPIDMYDDDDAEDENEGEEEEEEGGEGLMNYQ